MISKKLCALLLLLSQLIANNSFAALGVDSSTGKDLPIGAGGVPALIVGAGQSVELGSVEVLNKLGVGTAIPKDSLDVNGAIKIGITAEDCNQDHTGAIRWNDTKKKHEFCNGTEWKTTSSGYAAGLVVYNSQNPGKSTLIFDNGSTENIQCSADTPVRCQFTLSENIKYLIPAATRGGRPSVYTSGKSVVLQFSTYSDLDVDTAIAFTNYTSDYFKYGIDFYQTSHIAFIALFE